MQSSASTGFPFWKVVFSVAVGVLVAGAVSWTVLELRARAELAAFLEVVEQEALRNAAEIERFQSDARKLDAARRARIERAKPPLLPDAASTAILPGRFGCLHGYIVKREVNGMSELHDSKTGMRYPCRSMLVDRR